MAKKRKKEPLKWYVCRGSYEGMVWVSPACMGLKKYEGCVEYGSGRSSSSFNDDNDLSDSDRDGGAPMRLSVGQCKEVFFDVPKDGEAWLVHDHPTMNNRTIWELVKMPFCDD